MATVLDARLIPVVDENGSVTIGDVDLHNNQAWQVTSTADLWLVETRGSNLLIPGTEGVILGRRRPTATEMVFPLVVVGAVDEFGVENPDAAIGRQQNLDELRTRIQLPPESGATRTMVWERPDGSVWETEVVTTDVVVSLLPGNSADWVVTVETVGVWTPAGGS